MTLTIKNKKTKRAVHRISIVSTASIRFFPDFIEVEQKLRGIKAIAFDKTKQKIEVE